MGSAFRGLADNLFGLKYLSFQITFKSASSKQECPQPDKHLLANNTDLSFCERSDYYIIPSRSDLEGLFGRGGRGFPAGPAGKESTCKARDVGSIPELGSPRVGNGNPFQYSCLGNPMDGVPGSIAESDMTEHMAHEWWRKAGGRAGEAAETKGLSRELCKAASLLNRPQPVLFPHLSSTPLLFPLLHFFLISWWWWKGQLSGQLIGSEGLCPWNMESHMSSRDKG